MADYTISAIIKAIDGVTAPITKMSASMRRFGESTKNIGRRMTVGLTLPIGAFGAMALRTTLGFQESMNKLAAVMELPADKMREMELLARKMGATTQFTAKDAADALVFLGQAGLSADDAMAALPNILNLAAAGGLDMATSADLATSVMFGLNKRVGDLAHINDVLAKAAAASNTDVNLMAESLKLVGPVATAAGMSLEEAATFIGILSNAGFKGEEAGTAMRNSIARLLAPANEAQKVLVKLGITSRDVVDDKGRLKDFTGLINKLRMAGATAAQMLTIFDLRAGPATLAAMNQGAEAFAHLRNEIDHADGSAQRMAETMMRGLPGSVKNLQSAWQELQLAFADSGIAAGLTTIINGITDLIRKVSEINPNILKFTGIIAGVVAVMGPLIAGLGFVAIGFAALVSPIGLAVAGITAAVAAIGAVAFVIYDQWEPIKKFFADLWDGIVGSFDAAWNAIKPIVDMMAKAFQYTPIGMLIKAGGLIGNAAKSLFGEDTSAAAPTPRVAIPGMTEAIRGRDARAKVDVTFSNAPPGTRVESETQGGGLDLGVDTGYRFAGAPG